MRVIEQEVRHDGFNREPDAARLGRAKGRKFVSRRDVEHVNARAGPFRQQRRSRYSLDGDDGGTRGEMRKRVAPAGALEAGLTVRHDGGGLGMERDPHAVRGEDLEAFEHRAR